MRVKSAPGRKRARVALPFALLLIVPMLSGCVVVDFFTPQEEPGEVTGGEGRVRIWVAAQPGALGEEFAHLNITFGVLGVAGDMFLGSIRSIPTNPAPIDLIALEKGRKAALIGEGGVPSGSYYGYAYTITSVLIGERKIVGNDNGAPIHHVEERKIPYTTRTISLRAGGLVTSGVTTDFYLEANLVRSVMEEEGSLRFTLVPAGTSVYVDGAKVAEERYDGGAANAGNGNQPQGSYGERWTDTTRFDAPFSIIDIREPDASGNLYTGTRVPSKRVLRAIGLEETLVFDGSRSVSRVGEMGELGPKQADIVEYVWDFADGSSFRSSRPTVNKNYTQGGLYDVVLTVTDSKGLSGRDHVTLFVPYTADQAVDKRTESRAGTLYIGSGTAPVPGEITRLAHGFDFPDELEAGALRLGGYRVTLDLLPPLGLTALASARLNATSGHVTATTDGYGTIGIETAGIPAWRAGLAKWTEPHVDVEVELLTGLLVDYDLRVDALYYHNLSRGLDPHAAHLHGEWLFGPKFDHLEPDGRKRVDEE